MKYYKVLKNGASIHGGDMKWSLPSSEAPGEWYHFDGEIKICESGLHLTSEPSKWWGRGYDCYEAEFLNEVAKQDDKIVVRDCRLVRKLSTAELVEHQIVSEGEHTFTSGTVWASGTAIVTASGSSQVNAYDSSQVTAYDSSQVNASGSSQVNAYDSSKVNASGSSKVIAYNSSQVTAYNSIQVTAYDSSQVNAYGSSNVNAYYSSKVNAYGSSNVNAYGSSKVNAYDSSKVNASGSSKVNASGSSKVTGTDQSVITIPKGFLNAVTATVSGDAVLIDRRGDKTKITESALSNLLKTLTMSLKEMQKGSSVEALAASELVKLIDDYE